MDTSQPPRSWVYGYQDATDLPEHIADAVSLRSSSWWKTADMIGEIVSTEISTARQQQRDAPIDLAFDMAVAEAPYRDALHVATCLQSEYDSANWATHAEGARSDNYRLLKERISYLGQIVQCPSDDVYSQAFTLEQLPMYRRSAKTGQRVEPASRRVTLQAGLMRLLEISETVLQQEPNFTGQEKLLAQTSHQLFAVRQSVEHERANTKTDKIVHDIRQGGVDRFVKLPGIDPKIPDADTLLRIAHFIEAGSDEPESLLPEGVIRKDMITPTVAYTIANEGYRMLTSYDGWEDLVITHPLRNWLKPQIARSADTLTAKFNGTVKSLTALRLPIDETWAQEYLSNVEGLDSLDSSNVSRMQFIVELKSSGREAVYSVLESVVYLQVDAEGGPRLVATTRGSDRRITAQQLQILLTDESSRIARTVESAQMRNATTAGLPGLGK